MEKNYKKVNLIHNRVYFCNKQRVNYIKKKEKNVCSLYEYLIDQRDTDKEIESANKKLTLRQAHKGI